VRASEFDLVTEVNEQLDQPRRGWKSSLAHTGWGRRFSQVGSGNGLVIVTFKPP